MLPSWVAFLTSLAAGLFLTPVFIGVAKRSGFVAQPSGRGVHREPTPLLGGVAVFSAFIVGLAVGGAVLGPKALDSTGHVGFLAGGTLVFVMGLLDDRYNLSWFSKLLVQFVAAVLLLAGGSVGPSPLFTPAGLLLSLLWIVGLANAMNFLDNMDGIASGIAAVAALSLAALAASSHQPEVALAATALAGATLGFLRFNFHPARVFLGDAGSLFLGYTLAATGLAIAHPFRTPFELLLPVLVLAYPIFDITFVSVTRALRGQHLTQGGKDHTSHRLGRILDGARPTAWAIYGICAVLGAVANVLHFISFAPATVVATIAVGWAFVSLGMILCRKAPVPEHGEAVKAARALS